MTEKENCLKVLNHEIPEWLPLQNDAFVDVGQWAENERGMRGERITDIISRDPFGCLWTTHAGAPMPAVEFSPVLPDIEHWEKYIEIPDVSRWEWDTMARWELQNNDGTKLIRYFSGTGLFDRLTALMGFEQGLAALAENPEACSDLFSALADYKIQIIEHVAKTYHPDVFMYTDDFAHAHGLFMSPECYRKVIKPHHARILKAIRDNGMYAEQHTCGLCESVVPDFVEMGAQIWYPAHAINDVESIMRKYGDKLVICGGYHSQAKCNRPDATRADMVAEARRLVYTYAKYGGFIVGNTNSIFNLQNREYLLEELRRLGKDFYKDQDNLYNE